MASSGLPDLVGDDFDEDMDFLGLSDAAGDGAGGYGESSSSAAEIHGDIGGAGYDPDYSAEQESWAGPSSRSRRSRRRVERPDAVAATTAAGADSDEDHSDGPIDVTKVRDRRERNKESARASRKKRKALLDNLADRVTRLAEETDRRRLAQAEVAVDAIDRRKAELVAAARAALAMAATPAAPSTPDMMTRGPSEDDTDSKLETAAAAAAALPALIRERFSMAGAERRALLDFALEHSLSVGVPHHQRLLVYLSEQPDSFFTTAEDRLARIEATKASLPDPAMDPAFAAAWGIPQPVKASATTASDASSSALAGSSSASSAESESPDLWGILSNELWLSSPSVAKLRHILKGSHARELGKLRRLIRTNRELRAAIADRATVSARLSAGIHSCLFPSQELAFNDFLSRNAERIRRLMPLTSRTRSTDAQAAAASRVAQTLRGTSAGSVEAELRAAVSVAQRAGSGGSVVVASTPTHELSA